MVKYAHEFYRGIKDDPNFVDNNGYLKKGAFQFNENKRRKDDYLEMSINWNDSPRSLNKLMKTKNKKGELVASYGYTLISRSFLHTKFKELLSDKTLKYERRKKLFNRFHGNILFDKNGKKKQRKLFQETIANYGNSRITKIQDYNELVNKGKKLNGANLYIDEDACVKNT